MIEQNVQVIRCEGEKIWLRLGSQAGCTACDEGNGCGAGVFSKLLQRKPVIVELARKDIIARAGQMVTLAFPEQVYLKMVLAFYGWPLIVALAGAFAGFGLASWVGFEKLLLDVITLAGGLLAATLAMRIIKGRKAENAMLNAMHLADYYPSATPGMCNKGANESPQN